MVYLQFLLSTKKLKFQKFTILLINDTLDTKKSQIKLIDIIIKTYSNNANNQENVEQCKSSTNPSDIRNEKPLCGSG